MYRFKIQKYIFDIKNNERIMKGKLKQLIKKIDKHSPIPIFFTVHMTKQERKLFDKSIKASKVHIEYGIGGSTIRALMKTNAQIYSTESDNNWVQIIKEYRIIKNNLQKRLNIYHVDIGNTGAWGKPEQNADKKKFPEYIETVYKMISIKKIDTLLIDGRFRVACVLYAIINNQADNSMKIIIHDFWNREKYHVVLNYLDEIGRADSMGVFNIKKDIDITLVQNEYNKYKYIFD